jgi:hypothetical protein
MEYDWKVCIEIITDYGTSEPNSRKQLKLILYKQVMHYVISSKFNEDLQQRSR